MVAERHGRTRPRGFAGLKTSESINCHKRLMMHADFSLDVRRSHCRCLVPRLVTPALVTDASPLRTLLCRACRTLHFTFLLPSYFSCERQDSKICFASGSVCDGPQR